MSAFAFHIEIFGEKVLQEKFDVMSKRVTNARPAIRVVANYLMAQTEKRFEEQGPGWAPLTADWAFRKQAQGLDPRILRAKKTGPTLFGSVTKYRAAGQILRIGTDHLVFGSDLPYAASHQFGYAPHNIPQRKYLKVTVADRLVIGRIFSDYFTAPFKGGGRGSKIRSTNVPAFGGGTMLRGEGGRFVGVTYN
jgi:phage gpG-like protein